MFFKRVDEREREGEKGREQKQRVEQGRGKLKRRQKEKVGEEKGALQLENLDS